LAAGPGERLLYRQLPPGWTTSSPQAAGRADSASRHPSRSSVPPVFMRSRRGPATARRSKADPPVPRQPAWTDLQGFGAGALLIARFSAPFFFCLGFLASRLDRFCSLLATTLSS
jgi:hypothetical protein